jgi:hypothetical protein
VRSPADAFIRPCGRAGLVLVALREQERGDADGRQGQDVGAAVRLQPLLVGQPVSADMQVPSLRVPAHYATGFDDLVAFFRAFASDWRGWQGERTYESVDHDCG